MFYLFRDLSDTSIFIISYALTSLYFAGVMVRLILVATPAVCIVAAVAVSSLLKKYAAMAREKAPEEGVTSKTVLSKKASAKVRPSVYFLIVRLGVSF
jgi:dolichyl-diphosphooligosaccharide--protein glycosyltransferase